jgi:hypothetical protein
VSQTRWEQTEGVFFRDDFGADELLAKWASVTNFDNARHADKISQSKTGLEERLGRKLELAPQKG